MQYKLKTRRGLTLTELVVATVLMGIVMMAVAAVDYNLRSAYNTTSKDSNVAMHVAGLMLAITNRAAAATGMRTDPGIVIIPNGANEFLYFRSDTNDPSSFADDVWVYYYWDATAHSITFCDSAGDPSLPGSCTSSQIQTWNNIETFNVTFNPDENLRNLYLDITISGLYDVTKAYSPLDNPRTQLTSKIIPLQHTW